MATFSRKDFLGHWSAAAASVTERKYIFIDNSSGQWVWQEFTGDKSDNAGNVEFDESNPPRARLLGNATYPNYLSLSELSDGSTGLVDDLGHTLRLTSCVAIFDISRNRNGDYTKTVNYKVGFPDSFVVNGDRVEVPTGFTVLIRYNIPSSLGITFDSGSSWLEWGTVTKQPQVQLVRLDNYSAVVFDKAPAVEGDEYNFNLKASGTDIDPIVVIKAPPK